MMVEKLRAEGWTLFFTDEPPHDDPTKPWQLELRRVDEKDYDRGNFRDHFVAAPTPQLAICLAAMRAVGEIE